MNDVYLFSLSDDCNRASGNKRVLLGCLRLPGDCHFRIPWENKNEGGITVGQCLD